MVSKKRPRVVIFPVDCMKGKRKKLYMNIGKVRCSNMYENIEEIPKFEEVSALEAKQGKKTLEGLRKLHTVANLKKQWGVTDYVFYSLMRKFGVATTPRSTNNQPKDTTEAQKETAVTSTAGAVINLPVQTAPPAIEQPVFKGFEIRFANTLSGEELSNQVLNIIGMLGKECTYKFMFKIEQEL